MRDRRPESEADVKAIRPRKEGENQPPRTVLGCRRQRLNAQARSRGGAGRLDCRVANIMGGKSSVIPWGIQRCQKPGIAPFKPRLWRLDSVSTSRSPGVQNRRNPFGSIAGYPPNKQMNTNASPEPATPRPPATPPTYPRPETPPPPDEPSPPATPYDSGKPLDGRGKPFWWIATGDSPPPLIAQPRALGMLPWCR